MTLLKTPRFALLALASLLVAMAIASAQPAPDTAYFTPKELAQGYRERVIMAKPHPGRRATVDAEEATERVRVRRKYARFDGLRAIELDAGDSADAAITRLRATGRYEFVERDYLRHADATPNDTRFPEQWSLNNTGLSNGVGGADIKATQAWDIRSDASTIIVAVIDSGVRLSHPELIPNLWINPREVAGNGRDDDNNGYIDDVNGINAIVPLNSANSGNPNDDNGHGSHVAGIIGAAGNNGAGISGVAWRVRIMALKGLSASGTGATSDLVECINYAIDNGAQIINASYGAAAAATGQGFSSSELTAIRRARDAGVIFVAAAGNEGTDNDLALKYPASHRVDNMVSVGNVTRRDDLSGSSSNFGAGSVELYAPGTEILSLSNTADTGTSAYIVRTGTSMSAPHVVGALALSRAQFPNDTYRQIINRMLRSVDVLPALSGKCQTGGRLNLFRALTSTDNRPFNDDFANRARLVGSNFLIRSSNVGATSEATSGEPAILNQISAASLWWEWTPTTTAPVRLSTAGSGYDTLVAVYRGTALNALTLVAENDDDGTATTSRLEFTAQAGVIYQIKVDGKAGASGLTLMDIGVVPANDALAAAEVVMGRSFRVDGANANCTRETGEPRILGFVGGKSLWYRWTAPDSGRFQIAVNSDGFDPLLAVYRGAVGANFTGLALVEANDNFAFAGSSDTGSLVTIDATAGTTYFFQIDGKEISSTTPPPNGAFRLTLNDSLWQVPAGGSITSAPVVGPDRGVYVGSTDFNFTGVNADGSRRWPAINIGGQLDTTAATLAPDGTLYFGAGPANTTDGKLYAYDSATGVKKWETVVGAGSNASNATALAADGTIYLHTNEGRLFAYADDGTAARLKWSFAIPGTSYASATIAPDGTIYLGSDDDATGHLLYAINPDGTRKWTFRPDNAIYTAVALDAAGNLYFGTLSSGRLYSVTSAGVLRWTYTGATLGTSSSPTLSADGGTVYFGAYDSKFHAVSTATGAARWTFPLGREVRASSPAVDANGTVYIGCYDGLIYAINPDGTLKRTWATADWIRSSPAIAGTTLYVGSNDHKLYAFDIGVGPAAGPWPQYRHNARRTGRATAEAFAILTAPRSQVAVLGRALTLGVVATGDAPLTYQWRRDGTPIAGATSASYQVASVTAATAGSYTVTVTGPQGTLTSAAAAITVEPPVLGRLVNLSVRTTAGTGAQTLTMGFVIAGAPDATVLLRGIGPSLTPFGVTGALADPQLQLFSGTVPIAANDNWGGGTLASDFAAVGAFALDPASRDAALVRSLAAGNYSAQVTGTGAAGIALAELYDRAAGSGARLINVSARAQVGTGAGILIAGFTLSGNVPKQILIRAIGPALSGFGVTGVLANPRLDLYRGSTVIQSNDDWGGTAALTNAFASVGAFAIASTASRDAALLLTLDPGSYTAQVSGVGGTTGVALVEVYEIP